MESSWDRLQGSGLEVRAQRFRQKNLAFLGCPIPLTTKTIFFVGPCTEPCIDII